MRRPRSERAAARNAKKLVGDAAVGRRHSRLRAAGPARRAARSSEGFRPPFALIAGGRPDQAKTLEHDGITTYLHVPSPGLLDMFSQDGARRFIFEGRECGGHVGPRTSFVLWELDDRRHPDATSSNLARPREAKSITCMFAGGIHDALSAAMVAALWRRRWPSAAFASAC